MTTATRPSAYYRASWRAAIAAIAVSIALAVVIALWGARLGPTRSYLAFFEAFILGYAIGRIHQLADQRMQHTNSRAPQVA